MSQWLNLLLETKWKRNLYSGNQYGNMAIWQYGTEMIIIKYRER